MELEQWKQKYYDQLDRLEKKEADWEKLENALKKAIGRLGLAAEGQHGTLDRQINLLRSTIKNTVNLQDLESVISDISNTLAKLEDKQNDENRQSIHALELLVKKLKLPRSADKSQAKLLKKIAKSDDNQRDDLINDTHKLLISLIADDTSASEKPGLINRLFPSKNTEITRHNNTVKSDSGNKPTDYTNEDPLTIYKTCLLELLSKLDDPDSPDGTISALKIGARDARQKNELDKLSDQLSQMLRQQSTDAPSVNNMTELNINSSSEPAFQPSIQELLIRLLEQLTIPADLQDDADKMKHRLEKETDPANWKSLLKDVAHLINSIRNRMQKEKHEFEDFLQQVTDRLKVMDHFLQNESSNLLLAENQGKAFDKQVGLNVDEIRQDIDQATELSSLKTNVNIKLDTISNHIQLYRETENTRFEKSQSEVDAMQLKMQSLENEAEQLKKLVIEKNKQAMFDGLTEIPNRLSYEKKSGRRNCSLETFF